MQQTQDSSPRLGRRVLALAIALLLVGAANAQASITVDVANGVLVITGTSAADEPRFAFVADQNGVDTYTRVFDPDGVGDPLPPECFRIAKDDDPGEPGNPIQADPANLALCDNATLSHLLLELGGGDDDPTVINICFTTIVMNLGEGNNETEAPPCASQFAMTVNTGAGEDWVTTRSGTGMSITANLGGGHDRFTGGDGNNIAHGGDGPDSLNASNGNDQHFGEGGDDEIEGGPGDDLEDGGPGDDQIGHIGPDGAPRDDDQGADTVIGGDGTDFLTFDGHDGGVTINLDGQPNDGAAGEGDNIGSDFERIVGSKGNDTYFGTPGIDIFEAGPGNDEMHGGDGNDHLDGDSDNDRVFGDAGNDMVEGGVSTDIVDGGSGQDEIWADIANCNIYNCSAAPDELFARDGERDAVDCGGGSGTAHVDEFDLVAFCVGVDRQTTGAAGTGTPGTGTPGTGPLGPGADTTAPGASLLRVTPNAFRPLARGASIVAAGGTLVTYTLSEPATLRFTIKRYVPGRRSGRRCVRPTRRNRSARRCTFLRPVSGSFSHAGVAGANSFRFSGRLANRRLVAGRDRLIGTPTDAAANVGAPVGARFRIRR